MIVTALSPKKRGEEKKRTGFSVRFVSQIPVFLSIALCLLVSFWPFKRPAVDVFLQCVFKCSAFSNFPFFMLVQLLTVWVVVE